jgi:hypothetical protein
MQDDKWGDAVDGTVENPSASVMSVSVQNTDPVKRSYPSTAKANTDRAKFGLFLKNT